MTCILNADRVISGIHAILILIDQLHDSLAEALTKFQLVGIGEAEAARECLAILTGSGLGCCGEELH